MSENDNEIDLKQEAVAALEWEPNITEPSVNVGGRPTDYKSEYDEQAEKLCKLGATDKALADFFNVCEATINNWKIAHPTFLESITRGKPTADDQVEASLFQSAIGFEYEETSESTNKDGEPGYSTTYKKRSLPDVRAQKFWLINRQPKKWREKQEIHHEGNIGINIEADDADL